VALKLNKIKKYTQLVVESRASDHDTSDTASVISSKGKDRFQKRGKYTYTCMSFFSEISLQENHEI
jgi:hypothetical protein